MRSALLRVTGAATFTTESRGSPVVDAGRNTFARHGRPGTGCGTMPRTLQEILERPDKLERRRYLRGGRCVGAGSRRPLGGPTFA